MGAVLSLVRMWIYGIGVFIALTASLVVAMSIAIAGPPTDSEIAGVRAVFTSAIRGIGDAAGRLHVDMCEDLAGTDGGDLLCPPQPGETRLARASPAPAREAPAVEEQAPRAPVELAANEPPEETQAPLLGGPTRERAVRAPSTHRPRQTVRPQTARGARHTTPARRRAERPAARPPLSPPTPPLEMTPQRAEPIERAANDAQPVETPAAYEAWIEEQWGPEEEEARPRDRQQDERHEDPYVDEYGEPYPEEEWKDSSW